MNHRALQAARELHRLLTPERPKMSKLSMIADRIATKKAAHDAKAEEWAARLDKLDAREPEAFAATDAVLSEREVDLAGMETDMRKLSNMAPGPLPPKPPELPPGKPFVDIATGLPKPPVQEPFREPGAGTGA